jgi:hypothetical protein
MSIASRINDIGVHLTKDWRSIEALTGEAEVDKNIENIATVLDNLWEEYPKVTGIGESLTLNTKKGKMKVNLLGNTSQTGTPTPDTPIPVQVVSGDNEIVVCGKNLLQVENVSETINGITFTVNEDKSVTLSGTATAITWLILNSSITLEAGTYTMSSGNTSNTIRMYCGALGGYTINGVITKTLTSSQTSDISINIPNGTVIDTPITIYPMVEKGSTATDYEPYTSTSYPIHLGEHWLGWIGNYQDRFFKNIPNTTDYKSDLEDNEWYLEKKIGKIVLDGSEDWNSDGGISGTDYRHNIHLSRLNIPTPINENYTYLSNYFIATYLENNTGEMTFYLSNSWLVFSDKNAIISGTENWKTWLSTHNTIVYYVLATPTYTPITGTLKDELEAVWRANSYNGTTNISQVNNDLAFVLDVEGLSA